MSLVIDFIVMPQTREGHITQFQDGLIPSI